MDDTYPIYVNRVARMTLPANYQSKLQHIHTSPKFACLPDGNRYAVYFPGYSVITPPWEEEPDNAAFYRNLQDLQERLLQELGSLMIALPPGSFHITLADLIWENTYRDAQQENPDFDKQLQERIGESFQKYQHSFPSNQPIGWQLLGLMVMPRAIGVCLAPKDEYSYQQIWQLRRAIYQNRGLIALGIQQQYHFTAHVTLGYYGEIPPELDRDRTTQVLSELNEQFLEKDVSSFWVKRAELRKFDNMVRYYREPDWPLVEF
ncbi:MULTISPECIES: DUF1868 domain-containing protein [unclassified Coleofasciculus]|uniref:DUF1868 domain-containing protein n=1 Tax=unclassified Coleofasciculus TaxID=2692782 RepID=UPI00187FE740|nr:MULTISPECIES: DUF1868 domain-containing protein [unclassified Coleofasciculus]MBE9126568.1 DUF1868 domain-containing protein [Coleofasciculus sp. LEGE 07081]MBE9150002.1 DUF1868 domain-containing protein [Coleofasciculus sp. LEGE 07092]